jgi:hypothetical protein
LPAAIIVFWAKLFLGALFTKVKCTFLKLVTEFLKPVQPIQRRKSEEKVQNASSHSIFCYKKVLDFHDPSNMLCQTSGRQNHWSKYCQ